MFSPQRYHHNPASISSQTPVYPFTYISPLVVPRYPSSRFPQQHSSVPIPIRMGSPGASHYAFRPPPSLLIPQSCYLSPNFAQPHVSSECATVSNIPEGECSGSDRIDVENQHPRVMSSQENADVSISCENDNMSNRDNANIEPSAMILDKDGIHEKTEIPKTEPDLDNKEANSVLPFKGNQKMTQSQHIPDTTPDQTNLRSASVEVPQEVPQPSMNGSLIYNKDSDQPHETEKSIKASQIPECDTFQENGAVDADAIASLCQNTSRMVLEVRSSSIPAVHSGVILYASENTNSDISNAEITGNRSSGQTSVADKVKLSNNIAVTQVMNDTDAPASCPRTLGRR